MLSILQKFTYKSIQVPGSVLQLSGRKTNREYMDKLAGRVLLRIGSKIFLPYTLRCVVTAIKSIKYIRKGICSVMAGKIEVALLDGVAIGVSVIRKDMNTAGSVIIFLDE